MRGYITKAKTNTTSNALSAGYVFTFKKDDGKYNGPSYGTGSDQWYSYMSAGAWISEYNDQYLNHSFYFGSTAEYFTMLSGWHKGAYNQVDAEDVDIYKTPTENEMLDYNNGFSWDNSGNPNYKWSFYEVVEN